MADRLVQSTSLTLPVPLPDLDSAPFWEGCRQGKLMIQRCPKCGKGEK